MHSAGSMINTSPYLSNSFPEIGLTIVKAIAYTRKNVPDSHQLTMQIAVKRRNASICK